MHSPNLTSAADRWKTYKLDEAMPFIDPSNSVLVVSAVNATEQAGWRNLEFEESKARGSDIIDQKANELKVALNQLGIIREMCRGVYEHVQIAGKAKNERGWTSQFIGAIGLTSETVKHRTHINALEHEYKRTQRYMLADFTDFIANQIWLEDSHFRQT
jgi:hypothetical protein